jgi:hypothetical protein
MTSAPSPPNRRRRLIVLMTAAPLGVSVASAWIAVKAHYWTIPALTEELQSAARSAGADRASIDFAHGKTHHYRAEVIPEDGRQHYDSSAAVVPRYYRDEWTGSRLSAEAFAESYNRRMDILIQRRDRPENADP